jgi:hypothetical protein
MKAAHKGPLIAPMPSACASPTSPNASAGLGLASHQPASAFTVLVCLSLYRSPLKIRRFIAWRVTFVHPKMDAHHTSAIKATATGSDWATQPRVLSSLNINPDPALPDIERHTQLKQLLWLVAAELGPTQPA